MGFWKVNGLKTYTRSLKNTCERLIFSNTVGYKPTTLLKTSYSTIQFLMI